MLARDADGLLMGKVSITSKVKVNTTTKVMAPGMGRRYHLGCRVNRIWDELRLKVRGRKVPGFRQVREALKETSNMKEGSLV
jgi:hypothetical protein